MSQLQDRKGAGLTFRTVRDQAFKAMNMFLKRIEAMAAAMVSS